MNAFFSNKIGVDALMYYFLTFVALTAGNIEKVKLIFKGKAGRAKSPYGTSLCA